MSFTSIQKGYDFSRVKRIGVWKFESSFATSGLEDLLAKYLLKEGFSVVERSRIKSLIEEQKLGASGILEQETVKEIGKILGVDVLVFGQVTSFFPERKEVVLIETRTKYEEPVFEAQRQRQKDGSYVEVKKQVGAKVRYETKETPQVVTVDAQFGVVIKLVDVETGEICWVGSYTNEGVNAHLAMESTISYLVRKLRREINKAVSLSKK